MLLDICKHLSPISEADETWEGELVSVLSILSTD